MYSTISMLLLFTPAREGGGSGWETWVRKMMLLFTPAREGGGWACLARMCLTPLLFTPAREGGGSRGGHESRHLRRFYSPPPVKAGELLVHRRLHLRALLFTPAREGGGGEEHMAATFVDLLLFTPAREGGGLRDLGCFASRVRFYSPPPVKAGVIPRSGQQLAEFASIHPRP